MTIWDRGPGSGEDRREPEDFQQGPGACRICGRDCTIGIDVDRDGGICRDYNCHTAALGAWIDNDPAPEKERAMAWRRIFRESEARAREEIQTERRNRRIRAKIGD